MRIIRFLRQVPYSNRPTRGLTTNFLISHRATKMMPQKGTNITVPQKSPRYGVRKGPMANIKKMAPMKMSRPNFSRDIPSGTSLRAAGFSRARWSTDARVSWNDPAACFRNSRNGSRPPTSARWMLSRISVTAARWSAQQSSKAWSIKRLSKSSRASSPINLCNT